MNNGMGESENNNNKGNRAAAGNISGEEETSNAIDVVAASK